MTHGSKISLQERPLKQQKTLVLHDKSSDTLRKYTKQLQEWREWSNIEQYMKKQLSEAVPEILLSGFKGSAQTYKGL